MDNVCHRAGMLVSVLAHCIKSLSKRRNNIAHGRG